MLRIAIHGTGGWRPLLPGRAAAVLDEKSKVVIDDIHHQWKKDAPSGTSLMLGQRIAAERNGDQEKIDFTSVREGETIGIHTITFFLDGEELTLMHKADDRAIYALGAVDAGAWVTTQAPGLYSAADWLSSRAEDGTER